MTTQQRLDRLEDNSGYHKQLLDRLIEANQHQGEINQHQLEMSRLMATISATLIARLSHTSESLQETSGELKRMIERNDAMVERQAVLWARLEQAFKMVLDDEHRAAS